MIVTKDIDVRSYLEDEDNFFSGGKQRIKEWKDNKRIMDCLEDIINHVYYDEDAGNVVVDRTKLNEFIWYEAENLLTDCYGFNEDELWGD